MTGTTLSGTYSIGVTLTPLTVENPVTVTGTISTQSGLALGGSPGVGWTVANQGRIESVFLGIGGTYLAGRGIALAAGANVSNAASGTIAGGIGVDLYGAGDVVANAGAINGLDSGVSLALGGYVANAAEATIQGGSDGIAVSGAVGTITNAGLIRGTYVPTGVFVNIPIPVVNGISLVVGGMITNLSGGTITGTTNGVYGGGSVALVNAGTIGGSSTDRGTGIILQQGGRVSNLASGLIYGQESGLEAVFGPAAVTNAGTILASRAESFAVDLASGGSVTNVSGGVIAAPNGTLGRGVFLTGGTLVNAGTIIGSYNAVSFSPGSTNMLVVEPSAVFRGTVDGGGEFGTLELAPGTGNISGLGTQFVNFGTLRFDDRASWFVAGNASGLSGAINGFGQGDTIELDGLTATGSSYADGVLTLTDGSGSATLAISGGFETSDFVVTNVAGGTDVSIACFGAGTRISTPTGEVPVEELRVGDLVQTVSGQARPIEWIGRRRLDCRRHTTPERVRPIRIAPHAFGEGRPGRALLLSPDHSVFVDDVLIPIRFLINDATVLQIDIATITYYHLELPHHDVVIAEGLPTESYLETGGRSAFENGGGATQIYPDFAPDDARVAMTWKKFGYAPLIGANGQFDRVRARLEAQALMLNYQDDGPHPLRAGNRGGRWCDNQYEVKK